MPSKINGLDPQSAPIGAGRAAQRPRDATTGPSSAAPSDAVRITGSAARLAALERSLQELPAVDEARVAQIRSAIEAGRYSVVPERIASRLVELEQALGALDREGR